MKRIFLVALFASIAGAASAADMPIYRKAPVAPVYSWTGFYAGLNVGYGFNDPTASFTNNDPAAVVTFTPGIPPHSYDVKGVLGGAQVGYNWQVSPTWLLGLEADLQGSDIKGSASSSFISLVPMLGSVQQNVEWFGTVRARAGWLANEKLLIFGTGGLAYGSVKESAAFGTTGGFAFTVTSGGFGIDCLASGAPCLAGNRTQILTGYTVGGGLEYAMWQNVTVKAEYLYVNLGSSDMTLLATPPAGSTPASVNAHFSDLDFHVVRVGANWRF